MKHRLVREDPYIDEPRDSGYRGHHLVYTYFSDRSSTWNGLRIEMQIRSRLQHAWATAVETVGTFTQQALKSSLGQAEWLRFFALMSSAIAARESSPLVPNTPADPDELANELRRRATKLNVIDRLTAYGQALRYAEDAMEVSKGRMFLLELDIGESTLTTRTYDNALVAAEEYNAVERAIQDDPQKDAVLVSVESLASLRRAYPNYFLDTTAFLAAVRQAID
jgi:hypothetical protein